MTRVRQYSVLALSLAALVIFFQAYNHFQGDTADKRDRAVIYVSPATFSDYSPPGEFTINGNYADPPHRTVTIPAPLAVMKYQVTERAYARCVADGACAAIGAKKDNETPVTGVNYLDAQSYTAWLVQKSGQEWRLPNDQEWVFFSGKKLPPDKGDEENSGNKDWVDQWIGHYKNDADDQRENIRRPYPSGYFGENVFGIADIGGNVWEWTQSCFERSNLNENGKIISRNSYCGIMILQGRHRAYMPEFIRDASMGGCGAGIPPDYMGLRLVRPLEWHEHARHNLKNLLPRWTKNS